MDPVKKDLLLYLEARKPVMVEQLHQFCEINSGTENLLGLATMLQALKKPFNQLADHINNLAFPTITTMNMLGETSLQQCGDALFIRKRPQVKRRVLLAGHMDTVYGINHPFQKLHYVDPNILNGPGVIDMKGGLVVILHALSAFEETSVAKELGWDVFINADEEIGSLASSAFYNEIVHDYQAALVYEPATDLVGNFAKNRSGSGKLTLVATGRSAHAGRSFFDGRNAICYLAEAITAVHALNGLKKGVTINVGKMAGGTALNVVPEKAVAKMDVRIRHPKDEHWVFDKINHIIRKLKREDYSLHLHGSFHRPVKRVSPATKRLFLRIQRIGRQLGLNLDWQNTGGCCDGNNLAQHGLAVIDTLGVRGGRVHSTDEFILLDSLIERTALSVLLLVDLAQGGLEEINK